MRALREGQPGSTVDGAWWLLPTSPQRLVRWTHDDGRGRQCGTNPAAWIPELAELDETVVELPAGNVDADTRASLTRAALQSDGVTVSGTGAQVIVSGPGTGSIGGSIDDAGGGFLWGCRREVPNSTGNPIDAPLLTHMTTPAGPHRLRAVAVPVFAGSSTETIAIELYTGGVGLTADFTGTARVWSSGPVQCPDGDGVVVVPLLPSEIVELDATSLWVLVRGQCVDTHPGLHSTGDTVGSDLTDRQIIVLSGVSSDPTVAAPTSLAAPGVGISGAYSVKQMVAIGLDAAPYVGDGERRGEQGMHSDLVFVRAQSTLGAGANVGVVTPVPDVLGIVATRHDVAVGSTHDSGRQFRLHAFDVDGLLDADVDGGPLLWEGETSGTATETWVSVDVADVPLTPGGYAMLTARGNGGISIRFEDGSLGQADRSPAAFDAADPMDFAWSQGAGDPDSPEVEINATSPTHSTDPSVPIEGPFDSTNSFRPGNYPGQRFAWRVPGDQVANVDAGGSSSSAAILAGEATTMDLYGQLRSFAAGDDVLDATATVADTGAVVVPAGTPHQRAVVVAGLLSVASSTTLTVRSGNGSGRVLVSALPIAAGSPLPAAALALFAEAGQGLWLQAGPGGSIVVRLVYRYA